MGIPPKSFSTSFSFPLRILLNRGLLP